MIINKVKFPRKDMQLNNNQNQTEILNLQSWNLNLEEKLELILESSINNQQFVCREKKNRLFVIMKLTSVVHSISFYSSLSYEPKLLPILAIDLLTWLLR